MPENETSATLPETYPQVPAVDETNGVDPETIQEIIALSVGRYVVVEFLVGTQNIVRREGVLTAVGTSWLVLYDENNGTSVVCDMYSVKFFTYFGPGARPTQQAEASVQTRPVSTRGQGMRRY